MIPWFAKWFVLTPEGTPKAVLQKDMVNKDATLIWLKSLMDFVYFVYLAVNLQLS
jgi:hypothetical protein